jgi:hypothetical protein
MADGIAALALAAALPWPDRSAGNPPDQPLWTIEPAPPPVGVRHLASKDYVLKQRLLPAGLAELGRDTAETGAALAQGTQLIEVPTGVGPTFCEGDLQGDRKHGGRAQICFLDANRDGRFEGWFKRWSSTPALVTISTHAPETRPLAAPLPYRRLDPAASRLDAFVAIERRNFFNIYGRESFHIVFGSGDRKQRITAPIQFKSAEMPREVTILGARFTALSEADGKMAIEVHSAMPAQPFGVIETFGYR